ncbi:unnamed protein product [Pseudo-nitzschia multistriata]|uniref:Uncharacterized protein n=1 Tax=Pseudo-nitzschia multistriata TaxID=183589 RepID=A0A448Z7W8_9STRA|nr:unnamed protein product [Pseudo-nitzschia multistriata]
MCQPFEAKVSIPLIQVHCVVNFICNIVLYQIVCLVGIVVIEYGTIIVVISNAGGGGAPAVVPVAISFFVLAFGRFVSCQQRCAYLVSRTSTRHATDIGTAHRALCHVPSSRCHPLFVTGFVKDVTTSQQLDRATIGSNVLRSKILEANRAARCRAVGSPQRLGSSPIDFRQPSCSRGVVSLVSACFPPIQCPPSKHKECPCQDNRVLAYPIKYAFEDRGLFPFLEDFCDRIDAVHQSLFVFGPFQIWSHLVANDPIDSTVCQNMP